MVYWQHFFPGHFRECHQNLLIGLLINPAKSFEISELARAFNYFTYTHFM